MRGTKRLTAVLASVLTASALAVSAGAAAHNYKGDINRDDKVDLTDLVCLQKHFSGENLISDENIVYADMNDDGTLNVIDFMILKRAVLTQAAPEEMKVTTPAATTAVTTARTTTAATTKATTAATTRATTTTTTTKATTTTTTTTPKATTTTTTTTTKASSLSSASTITTLNRGVNKLAPKSADRGWIVMGGDAEACDYVSNASGFVPGSVEMPEITSDGVYHAKFYAYTESLQKICNGVISYAHLEILKAGTWDAYTTVEKPNLKVKVTGAIIDGNSKSASELAALTQASGKVSVQIDSILGACNSVDIEFKVEGFDDMTPVTSTSSTSAPETVTTTTTTAPSVIGDGVNAVAATDKARGFVVFQGDAETYDFIKDASQYIPGSVCMPEITKDGTYTSKYRFINPPVTNFYAFLSILQPNSYSTYDSNSGVTVDIKSAKVDGETVDVSGLIQASDGAKVDISGILTNSHELEITYEVNGINGSGSSSGSGSSTPSGKVLAGTDVNRAVLAFGEVITDTTAFTNNDDFTTTNMPEITGNGTYTASFTSDSGIDVYYMGIQLMKGGSSDNKAFYQAYPNVKINVSSVKVNGIEKKGSKKLNWDGTETDTVINFEQRPYEAYVNIFGDNLTQMTGNSVKSVEVTFTISGM